METYQAAKDYLKLGYHPIACLPREKRTWVEWKKYQTVAPTEKELSGWWGIRPDANVALVFGRGTFAVDMDGEGAEGLLIEKGIIFPEDAPRSKTARGDHVLLSSDRPIPDCVGLLSDGNGNHVDIRGVGYIVAPPSIHPTGAVYRWITPPTGLLPKAPQALIDLIATVKLQPEIKHESSGSWVADALSEGASEGSRDHTCTRLAGYFIGLGVDAETTKTILCETFGRNSTPPFPAREISKCVDSIDKRHQRPDLKLEAFPIAQSLVEFCKELDQPEEMRLRTHLNGLNSKLDGGFSKGELIYLAARAGVGKTALSLQFAQSAALDGATTLIVSHEMLIPALVRRIVVQTSSVSASDIRQKQIGEMQRDAIMGAVTQLSDLPIWLTDRAYTFADILNLSEKMRDGPGLDFLIIDYLQRITTQSKIDRRLQVEQISNSLKSLAQEFRIPVLCLSAVSRPVKGQSIKPTMESLRESGALEHDADIIILLDRGVKETETTLLVAKNRDGATGLVQLEFTAPLLSFEEVSRETEDLT